jgi:HTH-type transcriptional regulator, sugar sensing transcriptional regulator
MDTSVLEKIGLSKAEIKVYLSLLSLGSSPSHLIVRETDLRKSTIYDSLKRLQEKGLVSYINKDYKKYFDATEPESFMEYLQDKKRELDAYESEMVKLIDDIKKNIKPPKSVAEAHVLLGMEGFKTMRRDILKHADKELLLIGAIGREYGAAPAFFKTWNRSRQLKGIKEKVLYKKGYEKEWIKKPWITEKYFELRFLPEELESPAVINIYGDRVVNVVWTEDYPICFLMVNARLADAYKKYFNYLWKLAAVPRK